MLRSAFFSTIVLASMAVSASAFAQAQGGVTVGGDVNIKARTGDVTTVATGENSVAETNVGTVGGKNTHVGGDVNIDAKTGDITTKANGKGAKACSNIGAVGTSGCQN